jgi:hypothetical protein
MIDIALTMEFTLGTSAGERGRLGDLTMDGLPTTR